MAYSSLQCVMIFDENDSWYYKNQLAVFDCTEIGSYCTENHFYVSYGIFPVRKNLQNMIKSTQIHKMSWKIAFEIFIEINNTILTLLCHYSVVSVSTYQVSSARLERQSAQRMKSVAPRSGFEFKPPDFRPGVLTTRPSRQLTF